MKKHVYSLMMVLALVVLAGTSAFAQPGGSGLFPNAAQLFAVGSTGQFSVTTSSAGNYVDWSIYTVASADPVGTLGTAVTQGDGPAEGIDYVAALGSSTTDDPDGTSDAGTSISTAFVKFYAAPADGEVYVIEAKEYEGADGAAADDECISIRRVYLSVFDYQVDIFFCDIDQDSSAATLGASGHDGDIAFRNNWHNSIIDNYMSAAWLTGNTSALDSVNNALSDVGKGDTLYFGVEISFTGLPANYGLDQMSWRFRYSAPTEDFTINRIEVLTAAGDADEGAPTFYGETTTTSDWGDDGTGAQVPDGDLTIPGSADYTEQNSILVPAMGTTDDAQSAVYYFRMTVHKDFPETVDNAIALKVEQVQLDMGGDAFDDGTKDNDGVDTNDIDLADGETGTYTIYSSPATSTITITR